MSSNTKYGFMAHEMKVALVAVGILISLSLGGGVWGQCDPGEIFLDVNPAYDAGDGPRSVAIGDLDGDGVPDLVTANSHSDDVSVLIGNGNGTYASHVTYGVGNSPRSVAIGDLDGDGVPDLVVANRNSDDVSVLLNQCDFTDCPADLDGNGSVGVPDLLDLLASWGPCKGCPADFDDSGDVGVKDLLILIGAWGLCP